MKDILVMVSELKKILFIRACMRLRNVVKQALKFFKVLHTLTAPIPYLLWSFLLKLKLSKFENKNNG